MPYHSPRTFAGVLLVTCILTLAACGGGGGGGSGGGAASGGPTSTTGSGSGAGGVASTPSVSPAGPDGGTASAGAPGSDIPDSALFFPAPVASSGSPSGGTSAGGTSSGSASGGSASGSPAPATQPSGPRTLVLYDAPSGSEFQKLGQSYAIMLRNLLGHFDARVDLVPVQQYAAGSLAGYDASFYLGVDFDQPLPKALLADAAASTKPLVWFKYNLWQLTDDPALHFADTHGLTFAELRGLNAQPSAANPAPGFFDTVSYKGLSFVKFFEWSSAKGTISADPDVGVVKVTDAAKATVLVPIGNPVTKEQVPYVTRAGNFWYVADVPFSFIGPRDRYLVLADLLHDMLGIQHAESHKAMVRLEDVDAKVSVAAMKTLTDYLAGRNIPFSIATIPHYKDPLGHANDGEPEDIALGESEAANLRKSLDYALQHGGEIVMHGFTHQYDALKNPWTGVSGDDYEFWNIVDNTPVAEDSTDWALGRVRTGARELVAAGYRPVAWETPHYEASALASKAFPLVFGTTYQRVVYFTADKPDFNAKVAKDFGAGQIFPYVIQRDYYNQRVLPESLGNIEYDIHQLDPTSFFVYTWQDIALNARYALAVRDGYASFFFHPFWLEPAIGTPGLSDFKKLIDAITGLGFTWVAPSQAN